MKKLIITMCYILFTASSAFAFQVPIFNMSKEDMEVFYKFSYYKPDPDHPYSESHTMSVTIKAKRNINDKNFVVIEEPADFPAWRESSLVAIQKVVGNKGNSVGYFGKKSNCGALLYFSNKNLAIGSVAIILDDMQQSPYVVCSISTRFGDNEN